METGGAFLAGSSFEHTGLLKEFWAEQLLGGPLTCFTSYIENSPIPVLQPKPKSTDFIYFSIAEIGEEQDFENCHILPSGGHPDLVKFK